MSCSCALLRLPSRYPNDITEQISKIAKLKIAVHPHMLRHSTGYYLANKGFDTRLIQDYLSHKNITHTVPLHPNRCG